MEEGLTGVMEHRLSFNVLKKIKWEFREKGKYESFEWLLIKLVVFLI